MPTIPAKSATSTTLAAITCSRCRRTNFLSRYPTLGGRAYQKGLLTFVWRAEDENSDELLYDVLYRREEAAPDVSIAYGLVEE